MPHPPVAAGSVEFRRINRAMVFGGFSTFALLEEIEGPSLGHSMGLYIGGSAFGGMAGRVLSSLVSDFWDWRAALAIMGAAGLYAAREFRRSLPASRRFRPGQGGLAALLQGSARHLRDAGLPWLSCLSFLLMGVFVSMYNYIGYRLLAPPYGLRQSAVGALSVLYLPGIFSSVWAGKLADRLGRRDVLWIVMAAMAAGLLLTLAAPPALVVAGMGLFTFGFFASHSVCSSWVGRLAGVAWAHGGWGGVVGLPGAILAAALGVALRLRTLAPLDAAPRPGSQ